MNNLPENIVLILYRICQEAINNILRHSLATETTITGAVHEENITFQVRDNGIGFSFQGDLASLVADNHFGLAGMKERVETFHGSFQVFSKPEYEKRIEVKIPVDWEVRQSAATPYTRVLNT